MEKDTVEIPDLGEEHRDTDRLDSQEPDIEDDGF